MTSAIETVVIGIGSPFGADQLGWQIIEQLKNDASLSSNHTIRLEACDRPGTLLLEYFKNVRKAILIDAIEGGTAGTIRTIDKEQLLQHNSLQSSHQLGVAETITLGDRLELLPDELLVIGVETGETKHAYQPPTGLMREILDLVTDKIKVK